MVTTVAEIIADFEADLHMIEVLRAHRITLADLRNTLHETHCEQMERDSEMPEALRGAILRLHQRGYDLTTVDAPVPI